MYESKNLDTFNRSPSFKNKSAEFTTYDFELGLKVTATMTSNPKAELKIRIRNIPAVEEPFFLIQKKMSALIKCQQDLIEHLREYEKDIIWG
jgi:hypothetical protein